MCDSKELLVAFLYDELDPSAKRTFEAHVASCRECRDEIAGLRPDAIDQLMQEGARSTAAGVATEIEAAVAKFSGPVRDAHRIARLNVFAACVTMAAAAVALWAVLH